MQKNNAYKYANDFITCQESYLAGAEPREKRISELEKENAELKETFDKVAKLVKGWLDDFYSPKPSYEQRAELVKQSEQFIKEMEE